MTLHYIHKNKYAQPPLRSNAVQRLAPHVTSCDIMRPTWRGGHVYQQLPARIPASQKTILLHCPQSRSLTFALRSAPEEQPAKESQRAESQKQQTRQRRSLPHGTVPDTQLPNKWYIYIYYIPQPQILTDIKQKRVRTEGNEEQILQPLTGALRTPLQWAAQTASEQSGATPVTASHGKSHLFKQIAIHIYIYLSIYLYMII